MQVVKKDKEITPTPKYLDINNHELSKIPISAYILRYGTWNNFKKSIGETPNHENYTWTKENTIKRYFELKPIVSKFNGIPFSGALKKIQPSFIIHLRKQFGNYSNFIKEIEHVDLVNRQCIICNKKYKSSSGNPRHQCCSLECNKISQLHIARIKRDKLRKEKNCIICNVLFIPPSRYNYSVIKCCSKKCHKEHSRILRRKRLGLPITIANPHQYKYSKQELIENYYRAKKKLGKIPTFRDLNNKTISMINPASYNRHFGTWNNFLKSLGEPVNKYSPLK